MNGCHARRRLRRLAIKHIALALMLCALSVAASLAQVEIGCRECSHIVPYFKGNGGFIATVADGADEVIFVASCGNVTTTGEAKINGDTASLLFNGSNGLACGVEGGSFELGPIMDGGWFWITDDTSSAVGNLVAKDVLGNEAVDVTSAGDGVSVSMGKGAVFLKETSTGRVGILPTILPEPHLDPPMVNTCSYLVTAPSAYEPEKSNCMLGDGGTVIRAMGPPSAYASVAQIMDGEEVVRPRSGSIGVQVDLWGNGTGHFWNGSAAGDARTGHPGTGHPALMATFSGMLGSTGPGDGAPIASPDAEDPAGASSGGLTLENDDAGRMATLRVHANDSYCGPRANYPADVVISATVAETDADDVTPAVAVALPGRVAAKLRLTVVCPPAAASMG